MTITSRLSSLLGPALVLGISFAVWAQVGGARSEMDLDLVVIPFTPQQVRVLGTVETAAFVYAPLELDQVLKLERLIIMSGGATIFDSVLDGTLVGDPRFGALNAELERLPAELTESHRDRRYFAAPDAPEYQGLAAFEKRQGLLMAWNTLSTEYAAGRGRPFMQLDFPLHTDQIFFPEDPAGTTRTIELQVTFVMPNGTRRTTAIQQPITRAAAPLGLPLALSQGGASVHSGDLHVHSCHGEASGACAPSSNCTAESLQLSGSFSYAQLRSQYEALGLDWFSATDHSYCVNSTGEFAAMQAECAAATDASFLCLPDMELSSDEVGSQTGSDLGDVLCLGLSSQNHMGAHAITARIPGGDDGLLGFCDGLFSDVLDTFTNNIATVRAMGGYPIAHHPAAGEFGWNSYDATVGIESNGLHGVEIWNGATQSGQGGNVARWVDWMLDGRLLYAYSGSDTHDQAFDFGANHVLTDGGAFTASKLHDALRGGRHYISNGHVLILDVDLGGGILPMGDMHPLPPGAPAASLAPRVHYNFGTDSGVISVFQGRAGGAAETLVFQSAPLTGSGTFVCSATLVTDANSWVRAYSESGPKTAYTNPVFFLPSSADPGTYCTATVNSAGCGAQIAGNGFASVTSPVPFNVSASDVLNQRMGLLFYGYAPAYVPFSGGTLCVQAPIKRTSVQSSGGNGGSTDCSGSFQFDFNSRIQSGADAALVAGSQVYAQYWYRDPAAASSAALSNGLYFTVAP